MKIVAGSAQAFIRLPQYRFRPSQGHADCFHLDFWVRGKNLFLDSGSFCYNPHPSVKTNFNSLRAHNTLYLDNHEPMPLLGRFLHGAWCKYKHLTWKHTPDGASWSGQYTDYKKSTHRRTIHARSNNWEIIDELLCIENQADYYLHLCHGDWSLANNLLELPGYLKLSYEVLLGSITNTCLDQAEISHYYLAKTLYPLFTCTLKPNHQGIIQFKTILHLL